MCPQTFRASGFYLSLFCPRSLRDRCLFRGRRRGVMQAQKEPLNAQEVVPNYDQTLGPLFRAGRDAAQRELEKAGRPYNPPTNSKSKL